MSKSMDEIELLSNQYFMGQVFDVVNKKDREELLQNVNRLKSEERVGPTPKLMSKYKDFFYHMYDLDIFNIKNIKNSSDILINNEFIFFDNFYTTFVILILSIIFFVIVFITKKKKIKTFNAYYHQYKHYIMNKRIANHSFIRSYTTFMVFFNFLLLYQDTLFYSIINGLCYLNILFVLIQFCIYSFKLIIKLFKKIKEYYKK
jgi:hypothetical protein